MGIWSDNVWDGIQQYVLLIDILLVTCDFEIMPLCFRSQAPIQQPTASWLRFSSPDLPQFPCRVSPRSKTPTTVCYLSCELKSCVFFLSQMQRSSQHPRCVSLSNGNSLYQNSFKQKNTSNMFYSPSLNIYIFYKHHVFWG